MSSTKESKKEYEERLYNTKPKKMTWDELQDLQAFIAKNNKSSGKPRKSSTRAPSVWNIFMGDVGKRLAKLEIKGNALKFSSFLKTHGHYPSDTLEEVSDKELKKLFKTFLAEDEAKASAQALNKKAAADSDSDSSSDSESSDSEEEKPKPKPAKAKAKAKAALSESESEEEKPKPVKKEEKPKTKPSAQAPNKKEKVKAVDLSDEEEEEKPKPSAQAPTPKPKAKKEAKVALPEAGKTKVQAIKGKDYFTANMEGTLWVYELKEDGTGGEAVGVYDFETKDIAKEEEEDADA